MIAQLTGRCVHVDADLIVVDCHGVGYLVRATTGVVQSASRATDSVTVFIYTHVRDDAIQLFGFSSHSEKQVFEQLLTLQGVGPKVAIAILSSCSPADLRRAADREDVALLTTVPGVGPKVARRIVTELRGKLDAIVPAGTTTLTATIEGGDSFYDARDALVGLGLSVLQAEEALKTTADEAPVDERVRQALQAVRS